MIARRDRIAADIERGSVGARFSESISLAGSLRDWPTRRWIIAVGAAIAFALIGGIGTDVIPGPVTQRRVAAGWWTYPTLAVTAALAGLLVATYVRSGARQDVTGRSATGGLLSFLAIGCPACNKVVVMLVGTSGALAWWAPLQPILAVASIALLSWALRTRLAAERACSVPSTRRGTRLPLGRGGRR